MRILKNHLSIVVLSTMAVLCAGCKSCRPDVEPESIRSDFSGGARTDIVVPEPIAPTASTSLDPRSPQVPLTLEQLNERVHAGGLLVEVHFDFDRADLTGTARAALEHNARYLRQEPAVRLTIEGHCDERGTHEYNLALGQLRAGATREFLARLGIEPERLGTISYGEHEGACFESNESCWARNRRAYFRITGSGRSPSGSRPRAGS